MIFKEHVAFGDLEYPSCVFVQNKKFPPGMRKFRIDQDFLIEHWHMIYIMPVVFAEIYL